MMALRDSDHVEQMLARLDAAGFDVQVLHPPHTPTPPFEQPANAACQAALP